MRLMGKTVVLVLHEINYAAFYSDYIWPLWTGRLPGSAQWKRGGSRDDYD